MKSHTTEIRVRWGDVDWAGVVFYPRFYEWYDLACEALFDSLGLPWPQTFPRYEIVGVPIVEAGAQFVSPVDNGVVIIEGGRIRAVGRRGDVAVPAGTVTLDCAGATVSAGFWNSHVHFTQPVWDDAGSAPAERLAAGLRAMLTSRGFVRVVDT